MSGGLKYDKGKTRYDLIPPELLEAVGGVLTYGAEKYGDRNWEQGGIGYDRYFAAIMRHLWAYHSGEQIDDESGLSHLHHAACGLAMLIATVERTELAEKDPKSKETSRANGSERTDSTGHSGPPEEEHETLRTSRPLDRGDQAPTGDDARRFWGYAIP